jgi:fumarate reductase flavoprotein subunit
VVGIKVVMGEKTKYFKAKQGVILATGGFGHNLEMVAEFAPHLVDIIPIMPASHRGDGLKMAMAIGAATRDIGSAVTPSWPICSEKHVGALWAIFKGGILVNKDGKRFHDESSYVVCRMDYSPLTGIAMKQPGGVYWIVYDEKIRADVGKDWEYHLTHYIARCKEYKADKVEELAKAAGIDPQGLKETVEKYNNDIETVGYDAAFGREYLLKPWYPVVKIKNPPYYAIKCKTSTDSLKGGLKINARAQVVDQFGEVIPGLYAAGEVTGGLHPKAYLLGVMTTSSMTFGIIAGRNAIQHERQ